MILRLLLLPLLLAPMLCLGATLNIRGAVTVGTVLNYAADDLKEKHDVEYQVVTDGGSTMAIERLALGVIDVALSSRPLSGSERASNPSLTLRETLIGWQAVLLVVPDDVWNGGVQALTKEQFRQIYEREVKNWKQFGGPDQDIVFFNREASKGVWDVAMAFLYGDERKAPLSKADVLSTARETSMTVQFRAGSISMLEFGAAQGGKVHALGIKQADGSIVAPTAENVASGKYPLVRPLYVITAGSFIGKTRDFVNYLLTPEGQQAVVKALHVPLPEKK